MKRNYFIFVASILLIFIGCGNVNGSSQFDRFTLEQIELEREKIKVKYPQKKVVCADYEKLGYCTAR